MDRFRQWLASIIAPCRCTVHYDTGACFVWKITDARRCLRPGHHDDADVVGSTDYS